MMDFLIQKVYAQGSFPGAESTNKSFPGAENTAFDKLINKILENIVNPIILLLMALAVVYFLYGVLIFIQNADNPDMRQEGYNHMIWGIIGIFIMVSAFGIKNLIGSSIGI